jgi:hypothetical protein
MSHSDHLLSNPRNAKRLMDSIQSLEPQTTRIYSPEGRMKLVIDHLRTGETAVGMYIDTGSVVTILLSREQAEEVAEALRVPPL